MKKWEKNHHKTSFTATFFYLLADQQVDFFCVVVYSSNLIFIRPQILVWKQKNKITEQENIEITLCGKKSFEFSSRVLQFSSQNEGKNLTEMQRERKKDSKKSP